ncbi:hypothetical protein VTK56DRAFT_6264 [Thermocarpiscus australiensis]
MFNFVGAGSLVQPYVTTTRPGKGPVLTMAENGRGKDWARSSWLLFLDSYRLPTCMSEAGGFLKLRHGGAALLLELRHLDEGHGWFGCCGTTSHSIPVLPDRSPNVKGGVHLKLYALELATVPDSICTSISWELASGRESLTACWGPRHSADAQL